MIKIEAARRGAAVTVGDQGPGGSITGQEGGEEEGLMQEGVRGAGARP